MDILLSIKPIYANKIYKGNKKFEYRKKIPKQGIGRVYLYESTPVKKITGYFTFEMVINDSPDELWNKTKIFAGIEDEEYVKYFSGYTIAYAFKIDHVHKFPNSVDPCDIWEKFNAPQSYKYIDRSVIDAKLCCMV